MQFNPIINADKVVSQKGELPPCPTDSKISRFLARMKACIFSQTEAELVPPIFAVLCVTSIALALTVNPAFITILAVCLLYTVPTEILSPRNRRTS